MCSLAHFDRLSAGSCGRHYELENGHKTLRYTAQNQSGRVLG